MVNIYSESKYKWYVLSLAALTLTFCMAMPYICMSVLFNEISADIGLNLVQIGWIWSFSTAFGFFTVFVSGLLGDRFGARRILIIACLFAGLAGASRGFANDFSGLLLASLLFGLLTGIIPSNIFKVAATWFPSYQLGLANGILTTGIGIGFTTSSLFSATLLSPMLGSWRRVLFLYGAISIFIALLWLVTIKEQHSLSGTGVGGGATFREAIHHVLRNKTVWLISLAMLGFMGCIEGMCGYLPLYLREFKEWIPTSADGTLATFTGASTLGAIPISLLSDKLGRRKLLLLSIIAVSIIGVGLLSVADGLFIWVIIILVGVGRDACMALAAATTMESRGIGALYSGTAVGLVQTIHRIGLFTSPPLGNRMADIDAGLPFIVWAAFGVFAFMCYSLIRESGHSRLGSQL